MGVKSRLEPVYKNFVFTVKASPQIPSEDFQVQATFSLLVLSLFTHPKREQLTKRMVGVEFMVDID